MAEVRHTDRVRRIRVHLPHESTFVLDTYLGRISGVTGEHRELLGQDEREVAANLKAQGATFTDLDQGGHVQPARGYRSRYDRETPR